ncbi:MAG: GNAT family N-acetyltransferase [Alphaproteobacteria bacterium]|nr:GNAT family N-acetyltransferase [Alphaproteobacteria bacterium]MBV9903687.1 GNAT family N-acetyltransferase [Alphaproteobacteria bacterium]
MRAPTLETARLRLRAHKIADFENAAAMWADPEVMRFLANGKPQTREDSWNRMMRQAGDWALNSIGSWMVEDKHSEAFLGEVGFLTLKREIEPRIEGYPELGWVLNTAAHGKGIATEAVRAALAWGDAHIANKRYTCIIAPENAPSLGVARKCGFVEYTRGVYRNETIVMLERVRA